MTTQTTATISTDSNPAGGAYEYTVRRTVEAFKDVEQFDVEGREDAPHMAILFSRLEAIDLQEVL